MDSLEQTMINLKESILKCNDIPLDILSMLLSDAEVAKNIILTQNPKMTKLDADIMIDGDISPDLKSKLGLDVIDKKIGALSSSDPSNLLKTPDGKSAYKIANGASDLSQQSVPNSILNPNNPSIPKAEIPSEVASISSKADGLLKKLNLPTGPNGANFNKEDIKIKQRAAEFARQNGIYPLPDNSIYHTQAKQFKQEFRNTMVKIFNQEVELLEKFVINLIDDIAAISAAAILIAPLSFNVPGAITLILRVIQSIIDFCALVRHIPELIEPIIKYLPLVVKPEMQGVVKGFLVGIFSVLSIFSCLCATLTIQKKKLKDSLTAQVGATSGGDQYMNALKSLNNVGIGESNDIDLSSITPPLNPVTDFYEYRYDVDIQSATGSVTLKDLSLDELEELKTRLNNIVFQPSTDVPTNL